MKVGEKIIVTLMISEMQDDPMPFLKNYEKFIRR